MSEPSALVKAAGFYVLTLMAEPTVRLMAQARTNEERVRYFNTMREAVVIAAQAVPSLLAQYDADAVARAMLRQAGEST